MSVGKFEHHPLFSSLKPNLCYSEGDHTSDRLSDLHDPKSPTWWQSETIYEGIQHPTAVNLTLNLGIKLQSIKHYTIAELCIFLCREIF
jgi:Laminin N-terminal (Domain VI)